jgi:protein-S-isoprenylcysteine O-methyltransferase Ste14
MSEELPFRIIFVSMYVAGFLMRGFFTRRLTRTDERIVPDKMVDRYSSRFRVVFQGVMFFLWIFIVVSYAWYPFWMKGLGLALPHWLRYGGAFAGFAAFVLLMWTMKALGRYWSPLPRLREGHELITSGPYRFVRHPMYSAMIVLFLSFALVTANVPVILSSFLGIIFTIIWGLKEERMLIDYFGEEYREFMRHTTAFFPLPGRNMRKTV